MDKSLQTLKKYCRNTDKNEISAFEFFGGYKLNIAKKEDLENNYWVLKDNVYMIFPYFFDETAKRYKYYKNINPISSILKCTFSDSIFNRERIYDLKQFEFLEKTKIVLDKDFTDFYLINKKFPYWIRGKPVTPEQAYDIIKPNFDYTMTRFSSGYKSFSYWHKRYLDIKWFCAEPYGWCRPDGKIGIDSFCNNGCVNGREHIYEYVLGCISRLYRFPYLDFISLIWKFEDEQSYKYQISDVIKENPCDYIQFGIYVHDNFIEILNPYNAWKKFCEYDKLYPKPEEKANYFEYDNYFAEIFKKELNMLYKKYETTLFDLLGCSIVDKQATKLDRDSIFIYAEYDDKYIIVPREFQHERIRIKSNKKYIITPYILEDLLGDSSLLCMRKALEERKVDADILLDLKNVKIIIDSDFDAFDSNDERLEGWVIGKPVTPEQACDIVSKVDSAFSKSDKFIKTQHFDMNCFSNGYNCWCKPDGKINAISSYLYAEVENLLQDGLTLLKNFPYLDMVLIIWEGIEGCYFENNIFDVLTSNPSEKINCGLHIHDGCIEFLNPENAWALFYKYNSLYGEQAVKQIYDYNECTNTCIFDKEFYNRCLVKNGLDSSNANPYDFRGFLDQWLIKDLFERASRELIFKKWGIFSWCK